ncbi:hypothetical protein DSO57_1018721 [Entomophthora muscae]|uniref:Uncharacterized protein n=1 Tax=Entomophthora muscae TaxID=34485 RepID=A0ACC2RIR4_9FUNG|nr:hypothetical protein DSO57_1018721 [Entomophthora muscae]
MLSIARFLFVCLLWSQLGGEIICRRRSKRAIKILAPPLASDRLVEEIAKFATYASIAYCDAQERISNVRNVRNLRPAARLHAEINVDDFQALVYFNPRDKEIVTAFRGAYGVFQFLFASSQEKVGYPGVPSATVTKSGWVAAMAIRDSVVTSLRELKSRYPGYRLILTGHSLGGVLATLMAPIVSQELSCAPETIRVITYNQLRVGNMVFADHYNSLAFNFTRVINKQDPAGDHPEFDLGWAHVQREVYVDTDNNFRQCSTHAIEDPACAFRKGSVFSPRHHSFVGKVKISRNGCDSFEIFP